jgi:carboxymethylenebutenolidase
MKTLTVTIPAGAQAMALHTAWPAGTGPFPAIVVIQHAPGVDTFLHAIAERLAQAGYCAAAPDLYHRLDARLDGMQKMKLLKDRELEADIAATVEWLRAHPAVNRERLGIIGFCMGGRVAYLAAAANRHFKAAVIYYGGNIMVPWSEEAQALSPFARTHEIRCPLLFHFGAEDTNPSPADMHRLDAELTRHGKAHEFHVYPNAGHAFMNFTNAERYREAAAASSWPRTLEFLAEHLRA